MICRNRVAARCQFPLWIIVLHKLVLSEPLSGSGLECNIGGLGIGKGKGKRGFV